MSVISHEKALGRHVHDNYTPYIPILNGDVKGCAIFLCLIQNILFLIKLSIFTSQNICILLGFIMGKKLSRIKHYGKGIR